MILSIMHSSLNNILFCLVFIFSITFLSCEKDKKPDDKDHDNNKDNISTIENTLGFDVLDKVKGIWNGPVTSSTPLGGYPEWIVDFRPISENQIAAKNELDSLNDIFMSFFIAKYNNEYKVAFRNGGSFNGMKRVSYFLCDSVKEENNSSYYRFSEIIIGESRAYTEVFFSSDSLYIKSYTNNYNNQSSPTLHMSWRAKLMDQTSCADGVQAFNFPQKSLTKDFSSTFEGQQEAIYYSLNSIPTSDPYKENEHPYLGETTVNYSFSNTLPSPNPNKKVFILITTEPLISGFSINTNNMKFRSRYVILAANDLSYTFNYMHPGDYFLYALYDADGNATFSSGDWVSTSNASFLLQNNGSIATSTQINFVIP